MWVKALAVGGLFRLFSSVQPNHPAKESCSGLMIPHTHLGESLAR